PTRRRYASLASRSLPSGSDKPHVLAGAGQALPLAPLPTDVVGRVRVAPWAMGLAAVDPSRAIASARVLAWRYGFEMIGADAEGVLAQVVDLMAGRDAVLAVVHSK